MICPVCFGKGKVRHWRRIALLRKTVEWEEPCPNCKGSGVDYCCGGDQEQPLTNVGGTDG